MEKLTCYTIKRKQMPIQCRFPVNFFLKFFFISQLVHEKRFVNFVFQAMCIFTIKI